MYYVFTPYGVELYKVYIDINVHLYNAIPIRNVISTKY